MNRLFVIIGCLALALVLGLTLTWPKYQNLRVCRSNIEVKEAELQSKEEYFNQVKEISQEFEDYADALAKIASALPDNPSLPSLFDFLQTSASQTGLVLEKIELVGLAEGKIQVDCRLAGQYPDFKNFLIALENSARMVEVEEVNFESPKKSKEPFEFKTLIKAQSY